ncbi:unnamed protein product [Miscanthus lutarioriparius]|uniref:RNA polymerase sigma factor n=1 Tax=Miscanthus lutarioriparius TaxID=422564 RepID=A0A811RS68_9POAL|nr:unnamed protein product [Miscanthus lutarioriparius]
MSVLICSSTLHFLLSSCAVCNSLLIDGIQDYCCHRLTAVNGGKPIFSESLAALAMHLLLKRRRDRSSRDIASSAGVLQITENKSAAANLTKHKVSAERKLLDDALDRTEQYESWMGEETSFWMDRDNTNSNLQHGLLMQNLQELETSLAGKDLKMLENDILAHIEQLGALRSFNASMSMGATLLDTLTHVSLPHDQSDSSLLDHQIIRFDPETPLDEEQEGSEVVIVRSGKSQERKLKRVRAPEKGTRISVKVNPRRPKKSRKASSSQFISEWKSHPGRRRIIVREQSALLATIKECASLEKIREKMVKEGQEVSYHRWAEAAGVDEAELMSRLQAGYCCRERLLVTTEWLVRCIARSYTGMGTALDDLLQAGKMGVLDGAEKFDTRKGCRFSTYVKYWIRKGMLALLAENSGVTLLPARMESIMRKVKEARRGIRYSQGRNPSDSEIAAAVGVSVANVRLARKCSRRPVSLYSEIGIGQHAKFAEVIPDEAAASAEAPDEAALFRGQLRERLLLVLGRLPAREGHVLRLRHGLEDGRCRSLEEIGGMYRVSKEWIRKIEKSAMARLRDDDNVRRDLHDFVCRF